MSINYVKVTLLRLADYDMIFRNKEGAVHGPRYYFILTISFYAKTISFSILEHLFRERKLASFVMSCCKVASRHAGGWCTQLDLENAKDIYRRLIWVLLAVDERHLF